MASVSMPLAGPSLVTSVAIIAKRSLVKFLRTPQLFWTLTVQGLMFLVLFRYIFGGPSTRGRWGWLRRPWDPHHRAHLAGDGPAVGITEDHAQGLFDRLRSLPIPRSAVLAGRAAADAVMQTWGLLVMVAVSFLVGFRLEAGIANGLLAFVLVLLFVFSFEWVFITMGLYAGNAQTAQGMSLLLVPLTFVSSAYVPVETMPSWLQVIAEHQPVTHMTNAVRSLVGGANAEALLGHPASYFVVRSLIWSAAIALVFGLIAGARYRRG